MGGPLPIPDKEQRRKSPWRLDPAVDAKTSQPWFHGKPCGKCGSTVRFKKGGKSCVRCDKQWKKENSKYYPGNKSYRYSNPLLKLVGKPDKVYKNLALFQSNCCAICQSSEQIEGQRFAVDHCHNSGKFRGLLCNPCNRALGLFKDDPEILKRAFEYLSNNPWDL